MFQLSLVDHIRLSFGSVVAAYEGHTAAAARLARLSWYARLGTLLVIGLAAGASLGAALRGGWLLIAAPCAGFVGFVVCAAYLAIDPEKRVYAHRSTAARLWLVCEKFRALLAEIQDQLIDVPGIGQRRDTLLREVAELFEQAPPADQATYAIAKSTLLGSQGSGYSDQQLDQFAGVIKADLSRAGTRYNPLVPMTDDELLALCERWMSATTRFAADEAAACYAERAEMVSPIAGQVVGRDGVAKAIDAFAAAFAEATFTFDPPIVRNGRAAIVAEVTGHHVGTFMGMAPTGKPFRFSLVFLLDVKDGLIVRDQRIYDFTGLLVQLGVLKAKPA